MPDNRKWKTYTKLFKKWKKTITQNKGAVSHHELALMLDDFLTDPQRYDEISEYVLHSYNLDVTSDTIGKIADAAISAFVLDATRTQFEKNKDGKTVLGDRYYLELED